MMKDILNTAYQKATELAGVLSNNSRTIFCKKSVRLHGKMIRISEYCLKRTRVNGNRARELFLLNS